EADRKRAGILTLDHRMLHGPLTEAIQQWLDNLDRTGRSTAGSANQKESIRILTRIRIQCNWHTLADINARDFTHYLSLMHERGNAPRTQNIHRERLQAFLNYC